MGGGRICSAEVEAKLSVSCQSVCLCGKKMCVLKRKIRMNTQQPHSGTVPAPSTAHITTGKCQTFIAT